MFHCCKFVRLFAREKKTVKRDQEKQEDVDELCEEEMGEGIGGEKYL